MRPGPGGGLFGWLLRRASGTALVLLGTSLVLFAVVRASPGDPGTSLGFLSASEADTSAEIRRDLRLDAPLYVQYGTWLGRALQGNFGQSAALRRGRPVGELLWPAVRRSFSLALAALLLSASFALALAWWRRARPFNRLLSVSDRVLAILSAVPVFLLGYAVVAGGNGVMAWGARAGFWDLPAWFPLPSQDAWVPWTLAAGVLALGDGLLLDLYQRFRVELDHAASGEYLVGARVIGLSVPHLVARAFVSGAVSHLVRRLSFLLGSLVVIESTFGWPGLGYLAWRAAAERDTPVLLGVALVLAFAVRAGVLVSDAVRYTADPRSRS